ncbi:MAG TPA: Spy/CpxP family protein refolding chaperone, partial [Gemmatimonadaceae bacterium]
QARGGRAGAGRGPGRGAMGGPGMVMDRALLKDITLTDAQKTKLQQLRDAEREKIQKDGGRGAGGADFEAIRDARERGDTATVRRLMGEQREKMDARRDEQITAIRALLNADQLTQFDANVAELKKRQSEMGPERGMGRGGRRGGRPPA